MSMLVRLCVFVLPFWTNTPYIGLDPLMLLKLGRGSNRGLWTDRVIRLDSRLWGEAVGLCKLERFQSRIDVLACEAD